MTEPTNVTGVNTASVANPSTRFSQIHRDVRLVDTLYAGSIAMRAAGQTYLPKEPAESDETYQIRLKRTTLFNGFKRTVQQAVGKVLANKIQLGKDANALVQLWADDVDMQGRDLTHFAVETFDLALRHGVSYILVDYPHLGTEELTLADVRSLGARPYLNNISVNQVLEMRSDRVRGVERLTLLRILEDFEQFSDNPFDFTTCVVQQIKVFRLHPSLDQDDENEVTFEIWRQDDNKNWMLHQTPEPISGMNFIPIVPVYTNRTGFMVGSPPLQDLAEKNLEHWRVSSDHAHILHFCSVPLYFAKKLTTTVSDNGVPKPLIIAPNSLIIGDDEGSDLKIVEHTGAAVAAQATYLQTIEDHMTILGLELYSSRPGTVTATQRVIDNAEQNSILQHMTFNVQDALEQALGFACSYLNLNEKAFDSVNVNMDFATVYREATDIAYLLQMYDRGLLSAAQLIVEAQRRDVVVDDFVITQSTKPLDEGIDSNAEAQDSQADKSDEPPVDDQQARGSEAK